MEICAGLTMDQWLLPRSMFYKVETPSPCIIIHNLGLIIRKIFLVVFEFYMYVMNMCEVSHI